MGNVHMEASQINYRGGSTKQSVEEALKNAGSSYELPIASADTLGGVKVGSNLTIDSETGALSGAAPYSLPTAAADTLGGVKVGSRLSISDGVLSADRQLVDYSTDEVDTGVKWIDGKELYCKVFHFTEETEQSSKNYSIASLGADFVMLTNPAYKLGSVANDIIISRDQYLSASYNRAATATNEAISVTCEGWNFIEFWCVLYYTKATA